MMATTFLLLFVVSFIGAMSEEFHCWPESQRKTLVFHNSNKTMEHLQTIRFIQGFWDSQWALQYVGYLYLKEKIGLNVEFFPKLSTGLTLDDLSPYPVFYWQDMADNKYDLLLEQWPGLHEIHQYYDDGSVLYGGINGIYGGMGQYVPDYVYDELIEGSIPSQMKYNTVLRQKFIDGYTINSHSGRDWVKYLNDTLYADNATLAAYLNQSYSLPTYDKPIIFGSSMTYIMSTYTQNVLQFFEIYNDSEPGLDWIFCPLLSEAVLTEFVIDLYENKQPFIANIYFPHRDFATVSKRTGKYMRFEHIFIHRNTDNSREASCYLRHQCREPLVPLFKLGNPLLAQQLPEILLFLYDFTLLAEDLNGILSHRKVLDETFNDTQISSHEKWLDAACQFLKESDFVSTFEQEIIRYDCSGFSGCGFAYYYNETVVNNIGGYCANSSSKPECICTNKYLAGDDCRTHCDGLLGPFYNSKNKTYYFEQCGGNGMCDISKQKCQCFAGFNGDGCQIVFKQFKYSTPLYALFSILLIICILILLLSMVWLWLNQKYKTVKALSAKMTTLFSVGLILLCVGTMCYLNHPLNDISCNVRNYCYGLGAILTIMAPLCKTYRVALIFSDAQNLKKTEIPDRKLLVYLLTAVIIECCICSLYTILHATNGGVSDIYLEEYTRIETVCNQSDPVIYVQLGNYLYIFGLIMILCFFSFKNRKSHKLFKESKCAYFGSFFSLFVFMVVVIFKLVVDDTMILVTIEAVAMIMALSVVWTLFYGLRIYKFTRYPLKRSQFTRFSTADNSPKTNTTNTTNDNQETKKNTLHQNNRNMNRRDTPDAKSKTFQSSTREMSPMTKETTKHSHFYGEETNEVLDVKLTYQ